MISSPKIRLFIFSNLFFLLYSLDYIINWNIFILSMLTCSIIFVIPGMVWATVFLQRPANKILFLLYLVFFSTLISLAGVIILYLLNISISPFGLLLFVWMFTNLGIIFVKRPNIEQIDRAIKIKHFFVILFLLAVYILIFSSAENLVPPLQDHDLDLQYTAYGLLNTLTPFTLTDRSTLYDFAHPQLINFYSGLSILYFRKLPAVKYYYDYAKRAERIIQGSGDAGSLPREQVKRLTEEMYKKFWRSPYLIPTRLPHIFFGTLSCFLLFYLLFTLTNNYYLSSLGSLLYLSLPESLVSLSAEMNTSLVIFFSLILLCIYINKDSESGKIFDYGLAGFLTALACNKAVILPGALILREYFIKRGSKEQAYNNGRRVASWICLGFICGIMAFWLYSFIIDKETFVLDHLQYHFLNRFFHIQDGLNYQYPAILQLWKDFFGNLGFLFSSIALFSCIYLLLWNRAEKKKESIFPLWFFTGAIIFSVVDWRETYHLVRVIPPLIIATIIVLGRFKANKPLMALFVITFTGIIMRNIYILWKLNGDFGILASLARW